MKKVVLKLDLHDGKEKKKALKTVSAVPGIDSISMDMKAKQMMFVGAVDAITIVMKLRKYWPSTEILSVGPAKEPEKPAEKKEEGKKEGGEEGKKEEGKKEGGDEKKEEGKKEGAEEGKKEGGDEKKKDDEKKPPVVFPSEHQLMWEMMKANNRGYNPQMYGYNPHMVPYNPYMTSYNHQMVSYNTPPMASYNPHMNTHYVQSVEETPNTCTIS